MLEYKRYLQDINTVSVLDLTCPHCGATTKSAGGNDAFCNFCEQHIVVPESEIEKEKGAEIAFMEIHSAVAGNDWQGAVQKAEQLLKGSSDPRIFYLSALLYESFSNLKFHTKDYNRLGFMEENAVNIRESLDLTFKWKEYFFKTIRLVNDEIKKNSGAEESLVFIKFMSEIKLKKFVDAARTLKALGGAGVEDRANDYAKMVYNVEADTKEAEASLRKQLARNEVNAFYYLAKHLAKQKRLDEANALLRKLNERANIFMAQELLNKVVSAQEASKM